MHQLVFRMQGNSSVDLQISELRDRCDIKLLFDYGSLLPSLNKSFDDTRLTAPEDTTFQDRLAKNALW